VTLPETVVGTDYACDWAMVQNNTNVEVTGVAFAAAMSVFGQRGSLKVVTSEVKPVSIGPGERARVNAHLIPRSEWVELARATAPRFEVACGLAKVTYANGFDWESPPNPAALTTGMALGLIPAEISRSMLAPDRPPMSTHDCTDDERHSYTLGAIVPVKNEPGTFARCVDETKPGGKHREMPPPGASRVVSHGKSALPPSRRTSRAPARA
jgi:hypothetical protein